jgi:competence ComEA-like helix-hairpin-helix protein
MTPGRDAFVQLVVVLLASGVLRAGCAPRIPPREMLPGQAVDPSALADSAEALAAQEARRSRPLEAGETLDPNRAPEEELDRLPGVGPGLARAILAARDTLPFRSPEELARVRGIGSSTLERLRPWIELDSPPPPSVRRGRPVAVGSGRATPTRPVQPRAAAPESSGGRVRVNRAGPDALEALPGVGPVLAERIIAERDRRGGFRTVDDLISVPGIGPVLLERLRPLIQVGGPP